MDKKEIAEIFAKKANELNWLSKNINDIPLSVLYMELETIVIEDLKNCLKELQEYKED